MAAIGARTLEAAALSRAVEAREAALRERQAEIAETRATLDGVERDLTVARADGAVGLATLRVLGTRIAICSTISCGAIMPRPPRTATRRGSTSPPGARP